MSETKTLKNPGRILTLKDRQKLSPIEKELLECCKSHQPVLLYNDTSDKRNDLILTTHTNNGGKLNDVQYISTENADSLLKNIDRQHFYEEKKKLAAELGVKLISIKPYDIKSIGFDKAKEEILNKSRENFKSTEKCYNYLDCKDKNGKTVQQLLMNGRLWIKNPSNNLEYLPTAKTSNFWEVYGKQALIWGSFLSDFKGTLFVDNLECDKRHDDVLYYCKLADEIKNNKVSVNWLVVYVHNIDSFPKPLLNQFKPISLDGGETIVKPSGATIESEIEQQEEKAGGSPPKEESKRSCIFQKRDDFYHILYAHESFTLEATDGFKYIRYLLEHPYDAGDRIKAKNKFIPNQLFVATQERLPYDTGTKKYRGYDIEPLSDDEAMMAFEDHMNPELDKDTGEEGRDPGSGFKGGRHGDYTEPIVDQKTKQKVRELENERDIAEMTRNKEKVDRIQADIDELKKGYLPFLMKGGKSRRFVSSFHKPPYDNISKAMNVVYDKIKKHSEAKDYKSMLTWKHLKSSIQFKNSRFFYEPEKLPDWML